MCRQKIRIPVKDFSFIFVTLTMELLLIHTGTIRLLFSDMFTNIPEYCSDFPYPVESGLCSLSLRSLLIIHENHKILIDTGIGSSVGDTFLSGYQPENLQPISKCLKEHGYFPEDITDVILTHLHFDHCGGCVWPERINGNVNRISHKLTFPFAKHYISGEQWSWANNKEDREADSFIDHTFLPLTEYGNVKFVNEGAELFPWLSIRLFNGHTRGLMMPLIRYHNKTIAFTGDLIPTSGHIPFSNLMRYDLDPGLVREEKSRFLREAADNGYILLFQHDRYRECCNLEYSGEAISARSYFRLSDL